MYTAEEIKKLFDNFQDDLRKFTRTMESYYDEDEVDEGYNNITKHELIILRQRGEWLLDGMGRFFDKINAIIGDNKKSPV